MAWGPDSIIVVCMDPLGVGTLKGFHSWNRVPLMLPLRVSLRLTDCKALILGLNDRIGS